jgi:phage repressor protein C with HTH and peptisase S24 domain
MSSNRVQQHLRTLMQQHGLGETALARETGVPQSTIHRVLSERSLDPRDSTLLPLARYFGITVEQLRRGGNVEPRHPPSRASKHAIPASTPKSIPAIELDPIRVVENRTDLDHGSEVAIAEVDVTVSGGPGTWAPAFVDTPHFMIYPHSWFEHVGASPEHVRVMRIVGDSMEPLLFQGDRITVNLADDRIVNRGVYVFATGRIDIGIRVRRLFWTIDGRLRIVSDNPDKILYPDEFLAPHELEHIHILGRVIDKSGRGGL